MAFNPVQLFSTSVWSASVLWVQQIYLLKNIICSQAHWGMGTPHRTHGVSCELSRVMVCLDNFSCLSVCHERWKAEKHWPRELLYIHVEKYFFLFGKWQLLIEAGNIASCLVNAVKFIKQLIILTQNFCFGKCLIRVFLDQGYHLQLILLKAYNYVPDLT